MNGGEYQINDGIKRMMADGRIFKTGTVDEWMDCGNKAVTLETNAKMLGFLAADNEEQLVHDSVVLENSKLLNHALLEKNGFEKHNSWPTCFYWKELCY